MTSEEAIKKLKEQQNEFNEHFIDYAGINEAYNMAIKALEQESCEDAISRKDMLAVLRQSHSLTQVWDGFEKLPSVTPKEKTGQWINNHTQCSNCEWGMENAVVGGPMRLVFPFCPNCGARMEMKE